MLQKIPGLVVVTSLLAGWPAIAQNAATPATATAQERIREGDAHYDRRPDVAALRQAIASYQQALVLTPESYDALWRLARAHWFLGEESPRAQRKAIFKDGTEFAARARLANPRGEDGHYWYAVCLARYAEERGILNSLFAVDDIEGALQQTLACTPGHCWAHHVLGVLYRKAPGWPVSRGDLQKSLEHAQQAVRGCPESPLTHLGLAEALVALDRPAEARVELQAALAAPGAPDLQAEAARDRRTARALLDQLKP